MRFDGKALATIAIGSVAGIFGGAAVSYVLRPDAGSSGTAAHTPMLASNDSAPYVARQALPGVAHVAEARSPVPVPNVRPADPRLPAELDNSAGQPADWSEQGVEQLRRDVYDRWSSKLQQHATEPVDHVWSSSAAASLSNDLREVAEREQFDLIATQCRSTSCSVLVEWPDYGAAVSNYTALLHQPTQLNCIRQIMLPEPARRESAYQATILYDCSALRGR